MDSRQAGSVLHTSSLFLLLLPSASHSEEGTGSSHWLQSLRTLHCVLIWHIYCIHLLTQTAHWLYCSNVPLYESNILISPLMVTIHILNFLLHIPTVFPVFSPMHLFLRVWWFLLMFAWTRDKQPLSLCVVAYSVVTDPWYTISLSSFSTPLFGVMDWGEKPTQKCPGCPSPAGGSSRDVGIPSQSSCGGTVNSALVI